MKDLRNPDLETNKSLVDLMLMLASCGSVKAQSTAQITAMKLQRKDICTVYI
jgi:hypothetical protein